jgi:hypothetical protein
MKKRYLLSVVMLTSPLALAGDIDPTQGPTDFNSYSIGDICNRLDSGTAGTSLTFTEPTSGPGTPTGCTLNEVMSKVPAKDNANGATPADVANGKKYWGLTDGNWGLETGTSTPVDTSSGDATAADIKSGKKAWVDGSEVIGTGTIATYPAPVHQTGESGSAGVAWPYPRFTINTTIDSNADGNCDDEGETCAGTVTDNLTGLIWLQKANCTELSGTDDNGKADWETAKIAASSLTGGTCGLASEYKANDWRLPSINELQSLIHYGFSGIMVPNTVGTAKWTEGDPFSGVQLYYWSSSMKTFPTKTFMSDLIDEDKPSAWGVDFYDGYVGYSSKYKAYNVWPVRGGQ